jgi:hypothetical protein
MCFVAIFLAMLCALLWILRRADQRRIRRAILLLLGEGHLTAHDIAMRLPAFVGAQNPPPNEASIYAILGELVRCGTLQVYQATQGKRTMKFYGLPLAERASTKTPEAVDSNPKAS